MSTDDYNDKTARICIGKKSFSGWIDYDRDELRQEGVDVWVEWMEQRLPLALTGSLDRVFTASSPHHHVVNGCESGLDFSFYLCGVTLVACAIEGLGHFLTGQDAAGDAFRSWLVRYMPRWASVVDWLWSDVRNGLAHQLSFKSGGVQRRTGGVFTRRSDQQIEMDPDSFYEDFKQGVVNYFKDVRSDAPMKQNFRTRFQSTFLA